MTPTINCDSCWRCLHYETEIFRAAAEIERKKSKPDVMAQIYGSQMNVDLSGVIKELSMMPCCTKTIISRYDNTMEKYGLARQNRSDFGDEKSESA